MDTNESPVVDDLAYQVATGANAAPFCRIQKTSWWIRAIEIPLAILALIASAPIMLLLAIIIRRDSPGPALFFQDRVGLGGKTFKFVKFRTLYVDARERWPELYAYSYDERSIYEMKFKITDDPRVTRVGRWLRKTSLDELPNFWNVLTGEVGLVGPRPEIPEMVRYYHGWMRDKFSVRPGVTGLAQISGRGRLGFMETVDLDVQYVRRQSFLGDIKIILKTLQMVVMRDGAF
jgi:lipopolysaccharide/colanic/teichoic acid biosynthesis glycosyltransferase